jgi:hypothetical protein
MQCCQVPLSKLYESLGWYHVEASQKQRICTATRTNGEPCKSPLIDDTGLCIAHRRSRSEVLAAVTAATERSAEVRAERAKSPREILAERALAKIDKIAAAYETAVEDKDPRVRYQAASAFLAEAFGKPIQPTREEGGMIFQHPLLTEEDLSKLNAQKNGK